MTLRTDLTALLATAGITDVDVDEAVADQHVRSSAYQRIVAVVAASERRDGDRAIVATISRDPEPLSSKTAIVALVDKIAWQATEPAAFLQWFAELQPEIDLLEADGARDFVRQRIHDWVFYLSVKNGQVPAPEELAGVTDWMQRFLAGTSTSQSILTLLVESGSTRKIRNIAKNRTRSRDLKRK
jgi:hypothetical protein